MNAVDDAVASIMVGGGRAAAGGDGQAVDAAVDTLSALGASSGRDHIGTGATKVTSTVLSAMWEGGWQPAEVAREVRRSRSASHADLVTTAIAAEPAADTSRQLMPPAWARQLDALDARRWWGEGSDWLSPWATRSGTPWVLAIQTFIETLGVLLPLPPLELLLPPPSAWNQRVWVPPASAHGDDEVLAKVRALLAKAESTQFEAEAEALSAKAQELMSRHSIDDLLARAQSGEGRSAPRRASARRIPVDDPYADAKSSLLLAVGTANDVRCVWHPNLALMTVVGFDTDIDAVETLFTSLLVQAARSMVAALPTVDKRGRNKTRSFRHSFLLSFAVRIGERLRAAASVTREAAESELSMSLLPVIADKQTAVDTKVAEMFPSLTRKRPITASNPEGWQAGRSAADRAQIGDDRQALDSRTPAQR